jgi:hypothetical protein
MSILLLSKPNLRVLKNVLMTDYEVRSSHASELIAALSGCKSYAALKSQLDAFSYAPAVEISTSRFEERSVELGYDRGSAEWMYYSFKSLPLQDRPWLEHTQSQERLRDHSFARCEELSIPYVTIRRKRKYSYLEWDCISINGEHESHVRGQCGDELVKTLFRIYQMAASGREAKSYFDGSAFVGTIDRLSEETARQLANEFFMQLTPWRLNC